MKSRVGTLMTALVLVAGCSQTAEPLGNDGGPFAPSIDTRSDAGVDGLIVGHRLMAAGEYETALKAYLRAAGELGLNADVLSALGSANLLLGRLGQAEDLLRQAIKADQEFVPAWNNLGAVLMETGQVAEAARVFRTAFALDSGKSDEIRRNLLRARAILDDPEYTAPDNTGDYDLVRRGNGRFLLLKTP